MSIELHPQNGILPSSLTGATSQTKNQMLSQQELPYSQLYITQLRACAPFLASTGKTDYVSNEEVLKRASLPSIESVLLQVQVRWAGHVTRMKDVRMLKAVFFSELQEGKRDRGAPRKRYKYQLKRQLAQAGISHQSRQQENSDQDCRCSSVRKASRKVEAKRHEAAKARRRRQKERAVSQSCSAQTFVCLKCSRVCASRMGLYSHQRACQN